MASAALARITRYSIDPLDWTICPGLLFKGEISGKVTERVKHYQNYLPTYFPLVHPSPRNQIWMAKNPWFESEVVPDLKKRIKTIL